MNLQLFIMQILNGVSSGMVMFLVAVGLSIIFGTLRVLNLAHAAIYMVGAYFCYWLSQVVLVNLACSFWLSLIIAPICAALVGGLIEVIVIRRIYNQDFMYQFILTFGVALILSDLVKLVWGIDAYFVSIPAPFEGAISFMGVSLLNYHLFIYLAGVAIYIALVLLINRTKLGQLIRTVTYNREIAASLGIRVPWVYTGVFMLGAWLAGFAGVVAAPLNSISLGMDQIVLTQCFVVVVIGGMGSLSGAFLGAIILGLLNSFGIIFLPQFAIVFGFVLMAIVLIVRPYGLMGEPMEAQEKL